MDNNKVKELFKKIENLSGRVLTARELDLYLSIVRELGFSEELVLFLVEYCNARGINNLKDIQTIAIAWSSVGLKTPSEASVYITELEQRWEKIGIVAQYMGIDTRITKEHKDYIEKWLFTYEFEVDEIFNAINLCLQKIGAIDFKYIDDILVALLNSNKEAKEKADTEKTISENVAEEENTEIKEKNSDDNNLEEESSEITIEENIEKSEITLDKELVDEFTKYCDAKGKDSIELLEKFMTEYIRGSEITYKNKF